MRVRHPVAPLPARFGRVRTLAGSMDARGKGVGDTRFGLPRGLAPRGLRGGGPRRRRAGGCAGVWYPGREGRGGCEHAPGAPWEAHGGLGRETGSRHFPHDPLAARAPPPSRPQVAGISRPRELRLLGVLADVLQDPLNARSVLDHGDEPHPPASALARQRVEPPDALQQRRPVPLRQRDLLHGRDTRRRRAHREVALDVIAVGDHDAVVEFLSSLFHSSRAYPWIKSPATSVTVSRRTVVLPM